MRPVVVRVCRLRSRSAYRRHRVAPHRDAFRAGSAHAYAQVERVGVGFPGTVVGSPCATTFSLFLNLLGVVFQREFR